MSGIKSRIRAIEAEVNPEEEHGHLYITYDGKTTIDEYGETVLLDDVRDRASLIINIGGKKLSEGV